MVDSTVRRYKVVHKSRGIADNQLLVDQLSDRFYRVDIIFYEQQSSHPLFVNSTHTIFFVEAVIS